jgi:hypothetical protein
MESEVLLSTAWRREIVGVAWLLPALHMSGVFWVVAVPDDVIALSSSGVAILRFIHQPCQSLPLHIAAVKISSNVIKPHFGITHMAEDCWQAPVEMPFTHCVHSAVEQVT